MVKKEKITTLWVFNDIDNAAEFYKRKRDLGLKTHAECEQLLKVMAKEGKMRSIQKTKRSPDQVIKDYRKQGFKISDQRIKKKDSIFVKGWKWIWQFFK